MLDRYIRPRVDPVLDAAGKRAAMAGITPDAVSVAGFGAGVAGLVLLSRGLFLPALGLLALNRILDGLDGAVARARGRPTASGGMLDIVLDFMIYGGLPLVFAARAPETNGLPAAALLFSYYIAGSCFLAAAVLAAGRTPGRTSPGKSLLFVPGLVEGSETTLFMFAACLFPDHFPVLATGFAALCGITALARLYRICREYHDD